MDGLINFFNMEIGVFLRYLHYFSNIECVKISNQTVNLLQTTVQTIVELTNRADVVEVAEAADLEFLFDLDENRFELQRYIACNECNKLMRVTRHEYDAHACSHDGNRDFELTNSLSELSVNNMSNSSQFDSKMANTTVSDEQLERSSDSHRSVDGPCDSENLYDISNKKINDVVMVRNDVTASPLQQQQQQQQSCVRTSNESLASKTSVNSSLKSNYSSYFVKMRGLPWAATRSEIQQFFSGISIHNGLDGIHFITDDQSNVGVAFVEFTSKKNVDQALLYHKKKLDERYIEVLKASEHDLNLLAKSHALENEDNILRLEGLPWNAKEDDIVKFFKGLKLKEIKLVLDKVTNQTLEAFVRFSSVRDYDAALKHNWCLMGIRHVKIYRSSEKLMKLHLRAEKSIQNPKEPSRLIDIDGFPSLPAVKNAEKFHEIDWQKVGARKSKIEQKKSIVRTYMVIARGFQWKVNKQNVMDFFKGIPIVNGEDGINIVKNVAMEAHVELASKADRKKALALHNKIFESRAITVSEGESKIQQVVNPTVVPKTSANVAKIIQIRGLPWSVDKDFIIQLFPGMKIDYETGIQIEQDENQRRTGFAFVKFERVTDYEKAFKLDLTQINPYLKLFKSTQEFFDRTAAANEASEYAGPNRCKEFRQHFPVIGKKKQRS